MKIVKYLFLILVLTVTLLTSCNDDDNSKASIIGTWLLTSQTTEQFISGESQGITATEIINNQDNYSRFIFNTNGTYLLEYSEVSNNIVNTQQTSGTYTLNGSTLTLTYQNDDFNTVETNETQITNNRLAIINDNNDTTSEVSLKFVTVSVFEKQ